jgi:hypothetical protein
VVKFDFACACGQQIRVLAYSSFNKTFFLESFLIKLLLNFSHCWNILLYPMKSAIPTFKKHIIKSAILENRHLQETISSLIGRPMQCHIRFLIMWRGESKERERGRYLTATTSWDNFTTIVWVVVAIQLIIFLFYMHKIKELYSSTWRFTRQPIVHVICWVDPRLRVNAWDGLPDDTNVLALTKCLPSQNLAIQQQNSSPTD